MINPLVHIHSSANIVLNLPFQLASLYLKEKLSEFSVHRLQMNICLKVNITLSRARHCGVIFSKLVLQILVNLMLTGCAISVAMQQNSALIIRGVFSVG